MWKGISAASCCHCNDEIADFGSARLFARCRKNSEDVVFVPAWRPGLRVRRTEARAHRAACPGAPLCSPPPASRLPLLADSFAGEWAIDQRLSRRRARLGGTPEHRRSFRAAAAAATAAAHTRVAETPGLTSFSLPSHFYGSWTGQTSSVGTLMTLRKRKVV